MYNAKMDQRNGLNHQQCSRCLRTHQTGFILQSFLVSVEQCESWISNKEAFLSNQNLGVSPAQKTR